MWRYGKSEWNLTIRFDELHRGMGDDQDSYALCRVFKKNGVCSDMEEQGQCSLSLMETCQSGVANDCDTMSPDVPLASSSSCMDEEDNDESWMQFITDDAWCCSSYMQ
ncbi:hypothetical protein U1Q18_027841 [Sarracenia purpurea var. burkii]